MKAWLWTHAPVRFRLVLFLCHEVSPPYFTSISSVRGHMLTHSDRTAALLSQAVQQAKVSDHSLVAHRTFHCVLLCLTTTDWPARRWQLLRSAWPFPLK